MIEVDGMIVLVTGGSTGLGAAITRRLAATPTNRVVFTYCKSAGAAKALETDYPNTQGIACDFRDARSVAALVARMPELAPDAIVNNAVTGLRKQHFLKADPEAFLDSFRADIVPTLALTQAAAAVFKRKKAGRIVTILSDALAGMPPIGWSAYVANKAYLAAMSNTWATELARYGVSANCVSPSYMETPLTADTDERVVAQLREQHPLGRLVSPDEVADVVAYLLTGPSQINGTTVVVNGGSRR